jgi:urease accessory protein
MKRTIVTTLTTIAFVFAPVIAFAHPGHGGADGMIQGFAHPLSGIDHVLAMVAVGLLAAQFGGRALWLVPLSFVSMMAVAGAVAMAGIRIPLAEFGIASSVVVLGLVVAFRFSLSVLAAMALAGFFAVFHGYVHGAELPAGVPHLLYAAGFVGATMLLHTAGIGLGLFAGQSGGKIGSGLLQAGGGAAALFGIAVISGLF